MDFQSRGIRRKALAKLAELSATSPSKNDKQADFERLYRIAPEHIINNNNNINSGYEGQEQHAPPMNIRQFEVLLSLCKAAPLIKDYERAQKLAYQLAPHTAAAHNQTFVPSPFFREIEPSPVEALSYNLISALLYIGIEHGALQDDISVEIQRYLEGCMDSATTLVHRHEISMENEEADSIDDAVNTARVAMSMLGFLDAAATYANFWSAPERLALIDIVHKILSDGFLMTVEIAFSQIRNYHHTHGPVREWKRYVRHYAATGRPLGAMILQRSFMWLLVASSSLLITDAKHLRDQGVLDLMMGEIIPRPISSHGSEAFASIEAMAQIVVDEIGKLEDGADYLRLGSAWQQRLAFAVKAGALTCYINLVTLNDNAADAETLTSWLEDTLADPVQMADETLANVVLKGLALAAKLSPALAPNMSRLLPRFIVQGAPRGETVATAATCLAFVLRQLSQDAVISTLYTLGNVLTTGNTERALASQTTGDIVNNHFYSGKQTGSAISLGTGGDEDSAAAYGNVVQAIRAIAASCGDNKITALAQSMLLQKIGKIDPGVDARIIYEAAVLTAAGAPLELKSLLKFYANLGQNAVAAEDNSLLNALLKTRNYLSRTLKKGTTEFDIYIEHILEAIISRGDVHQMHHKKESDVELAAREIETLLQPLAILMSANNMLEDMHSVDDDLSALIRDAWFNMVVHGFTTCTDRGKKFVNELRVMAIHSKPMVTEQRGEQAESDIELNSVLRRGMSPEHEALQKKRLSTLLPLKASQIRSLSYRKIIFLHAAYLVETLRADSGDCTKAMIYFLEPGMRSGEMSDVMDEITDVVMDTYLQKALTGANSTFSAPYVAKQLVAIFCGCTHRIERVQDAAIKCARKILSSVTSALCQKESVFALLELLTIMWTSCLEAETDEYEWRSSFTSARCHFTIQLGDNFDFRKRTLSRLYNEAKVWVMAVINIAPLDVKGLLQTYLSEYDDDGAYGHISLGRSFAAEMGGKIPVTDQRLGAIDRHGDVNINSISDFVAQYTTRQEYRYAEALPDHDAEWLNFMRITGQRPNSVNGEPVVSTESADALTILTQLDVRTQQGKFVPIAELKDVLRRAAALLCRSKGDEGAIVKHLVGIPFAHFTKHTIKLGISLWLGVINENPRMESRILMEVAQQWEATVHNKKAIFHDTFRHPDPFFVKEEYAPSDREALHKKQIAASNLLAPHSRLVQFMMSHFSATRLCSAHIQKAFVRLLHVTLDGLQKHATNHPLAREVRFQIILFSARVLRYGTALTAVGQWRLKTQVLNAALSWFAFAPQFSFGGNRLQLKAETRLLSDVATALKSVEFIAPKNPVSAKRLRDKEELLVALLENEQSRLRVWLHPLRDVPDPLVTNVQVTEPSDILALRLVNTAWELDARLAIQLTARFQNVKLHLAVRQCLLTYPEKALNEKAAMDVMINGGLPRDVDWQLKYLLYWAPVDPISAVTYFLPQYGNNPLITQYAMRALESHNVDVTFFYVPQIVQALRNDTLGYVERYILETAKLSQMFAHQIIWNMKANAYKDEDSTIPDAIKPRLDHVMDRMVTGFSGADRDFYEREFAFFDEVTSISGKLKPFIKAPKPEKKQKIEEELRKIKVDVGVYLPSNPDGVVIGIDRKSGKPLQSHAKAPYMATFRIKKNLATGSDMENVDDRTDKEVAVRKPVESIEVWQSAIFKVGDDCRQDVLALQMISAFRGIFNSVGLDVYVFPYRVTATAPGCGVIDVLPNSISRDMLGREAVNGLYDYFVSKYGSEDSVRFQEARNNFVKSMAAYSVISYLLQFKDRHNGNIMVDDAGHILHIDFGFCFDIAPGGVKFERAPFKLTSEMVAVMGGDVNGQSYRWFEELCVKSFLAARPHVESLSRIVLMMMQSGLPCFKPETIANFKDRFVVERSERDAAVFMRGLVKRSWGSVSTGVYDQFQLMTNGIPF